MIYRVKDFETKFERAQSRKVKEIKWIALSIDLSDSDLRRLGEHEQGTEIYAAWVLICQVAARAPIRGLLYKNGRAMTASDLHYGRPCFARAQRLRLYRRNIN
jgi:hypothetical protein